MKKVIYFDWFSGGTEFYRLLPLEYLANPDMQITRSTETNITFATLTGYDVMIICRPSSNQSLNLIKLAKDMGIKVVSDFDDDCLHVPQDNPMHEFYENDKRLTIECISLSDEVWVSTKGLKSAFKLYNRNISVINNAHNDYLFKVEDKVPFVFNKVASWRGGDSHEGDIYDIGIPEKIVKMVNTNTDWTFKFFGQRFKYLEKRCGENYIIAGRASTIQFHKMMHKENSCVFFYPLADTMFNRSKSNIAWLEATYAGSAFFGSKLPEFSHSSISDFEVLAGMSKRKKLNEVDLKKMNEDSWSIICESYLLSKINNLRVERILAL